MIVSPNLTGISSIFLTVVLIVYLIIVELGNKRIRKALFPFIFVLIVTFLIMAIKDIYLKWINLK